MEHIMNFGSTVLGHVISFIRSLYKNYDKVGIFVLAVGGFFHTAFIPTHVNSIILLYSQNIGFFMFMVILMSIINIFNAINFNKHRNLTMLLAIYVVSALMVYASINYIQISFNEVLTIDTVELTKIMYTSTLYMMIIIGTTIAGNILCTISYLARRK